MPIYEYVCYKCDSHIEVIQKVNDPPLKRCAKCRGKLEKKVSRASFQLKGSGWYVTDYSRKDATAEKDKPEKSAEKKPETKSTTATSADGD